MSDGLLDPLRHNTWATKELLAFCRKLDAEQLAATSEGTYGSVLSTLQHMVGAESRYRFRLSGIEPDWPRKPEDTDDLEELSRMNDEMGGFWEELPSGQFDPDRDIRSGREGGEQFEVKAGVLVAQVLNHGNEHRAQIYTIITTLGMEPPNFDAWTYGEATGRFRFLSE